MLREKQFDEAISEILELELNYTVVEEESDDVPSGYVIRQTPLGGTKQQRRYYKYPRQQR